jgi:hypothetical protein
MIRAGVVNHPEKWKESGFSEIQKPAKRYAIIDLQSLSDRIRETFKEHTASGLNKSWRTACRFVMSAGRKRSQSVAWALLRT